MNRDDVTAIIVVGAAGHGREMAGIVRAAPGFELVGLVDDDPDRRSLVEALGAVFLGDTAALERRTDVRYVIGVGHERVRADLDHRLTAAGLRPATVVHPDATIGPANALGPGVVLFPGARVTTNVTLGRHTHLNVNSTVSHDCVVGSHVSISPGATVAGSCTIGDRVLIGAGATVRQGCHIGDDAVVGAGAVVVDDVPAGVTVVGVPARPLDRH